MSEIIEYLKVTSALISSMGRASIGNYFSPHQYILENGRLFESQELTPEEEQLVSTLDMAQFKTRECFKNAQILAVLSSLTVKADVRYCEGMAMGNTIAVEHAWVTLNGKVIDLTWGPMRLVTPTGKRPYLRRSSRVLGVIPEGWEYYGMEISTQLVGESLSAHHVFASVIDDYICGWPMLRGDNKHTKRLGG